jgi:methyltransferase (TIGR00027 family)
MPNPSLIEHVSDTAYWVATYRAAESRRPDALFRDPLAERLVGERGHQIVASMSTTGKYSAWTLVMRTLLIDELIQKQVQGGEVTTVINLGAGLDTRPYRLNMPSTVHWVELDFPDVIEMKNTELAAEKPRCRLERIAVDLSNDLQRKKALAELSARMGPAIVLTEGVIPYLTEEMVRALVRDLLAYPEFRFWIVEYYAPSLYPRFQSEAFKKALGNAPFRFFPQDWFALFADCGWKRREIRYLYDLGEKTGRPFPLPWPFSMIRRWVNREKLGERLRLQAYAVLERG